MPIPEPTVPTDDYDRKQGKQGPDAPKLTPDQAWGESQNPVRETPDAATGLKSFG